MINDMCPYKRIVCDPKKIENCPYDGKCVLYHAEARGSGFITSTLARGDDDLLDFIKRQLAKGDLEVKVRLDR